jgi:carbonic anhydrase
MQVFLNDADYTSFYCLSSRINVAIRFQISDTDNPFFDWITQSDPSLMEVDLSMIMDRTFAMNNYLNGYIGGDTFPPCNNNVCWVVVEQLFPISQTQLDFFKVDGVTSNNRVYNFGNMSTLLLYNAPGAFTDLDNTA